MMQYYLLNRNKGTQPAKRHIDVCKVTLTTLSTKYPTNNILLILSNIGTCVLDKANRNKFIFSVNAVITILMNLNIVRYVGGELNACYNAVDRHVESGKGSKIALIHDSPLTGTVRRVSYADLLDKVN